jgi:hypothetical protein
LNANGAPNGMYQSRSKLAHAWKLPKWGLAAEDEVPKWLVMRMQSGELELNSLGGFTVATQWGLATCAAGDFVILTEDDRIEFCRPEHFDRDFEPASQRLAA